MATSTKPGIRKVPMGAPVVVGRDPLDIVEILTSAHSAVIFAPLGFGKTVLVDAVSAMLRTVGREPLSIAGTALSNSTPFGGLTNGSNLPLALALTGSEPASSARLLAHAVETTQSATPVIIVDDAHLLDAHSIHTLCQLASARAIALLLTSEPVPARPTAEASPHATASTLRILEEFWISGGAERIDLVPLSAEHSRELVALFAPQACFDRVTHALLHARSGGSRLLLRELTAEATLHQTRSDERDLMALAFPTPPQRILDILAHQLRALTPTQVGTLALIGRVNGMSEARALTICDSAELRDLLQRGYLRPTAERARQQLEAHTMLAEAAATLCDAGILRGQTARVVSLVLTDRRHGLASSPAECVLIADSWTTNLTLSPGIVAEWGSRVVADVFLMAARRSRSLGLSEQALLFARLSAEVEPGLKATIELSRALASAGRYPAALAALAAAENDLATPSDGVTLARWRVSLAKFTPMSADEFTALAEDAAGWFPGSILMHGEVEFIRLTHSLRNPHWTDTVPTGERIARNPNYDTVTRIRAACLAAIGHAHEGRTAQALRVLDLATTVNQHDRAVRDADIYSSDGLALEIFYSGAAVRCMSGFDVQAVSDELDRWIGRSVNAHDQGNLGFLAFVAAQLAQFRGDAAGTEAELRMAEAHFTRADPQHWSPWLRCLHASSLARLGLMEAARIKMTAARQTHEGMDAFYTFESDRSDLEFLLRSGNTDGARLLASRLYECAADRDPVTRAWLLDVLVSLGDPATDLTGVLERTVAETDSPLIVALARRTRAKADDNAEALDDAAADLSGLGAFGLAGAASDDAARLHDRDGDAAAAAQSREDAELSSVASRGQTHLLPPRGAHSGALLTGREREIFALVSQGLSNRAIASDLFLSVRTVESHLYKARVKTGLSARGSTANADAP